MANRPEFTEEETFLLNFAKANSTGRQSAIYVWSYLIIALAIVYWGITSANTPITIAGVVVLVVARLQELGQDRRWTNIWRSIIDKYEAALAEEAE